MTDYTISCKLSNETVYAYYRGRFWHWNGSIWKESRIMTHRFELARVADKKLTPQEFLTNGAEFAPLDEYEIDCVMLDALENAKPCRNAPIEPVEEESECAPAQNADAAVTTAENAVPTATAATPTISESGADASASTPATSLQNCESVPAASAGGSSVPTPSAPSFDFSPLGELSGQAAEADQQFDLHYGAAQDEYLISCIYLARIHALTAKAGRYGGGTWTKWYESKGLSHGSVTKMVQNGEAFNSSTVDELKQLPELTRKDLNLIARSGCAEQVVAAGGDSQRVQALLAQIKAEKERADAAETREEEARKAAHEYHEKYEEAAAMRATLLDQQGVYIADIDGLKKQNAKLQQSYHDADESRIAANLQRQKAEAERDRAEERAKNAEDALKKQPITAVIDEEEIDRRAAEKAWGLADARNAELAKDNANLKKQVAALRSRINDDAQADFEQANYCASLMRAAWDNSKASYSRLVGEDLESTFQTICSTLNSIMEEASLLCRQPPDYDGGDKDE